MRLMFWAMSLQLTEGKPVTLQAISGAVERILVKDLGTVVLVCRQDEYAAARQEGREPVTVGVRREDVIK